MSEAVAEQAEYGNWVSARLVFVPGLLGLLFAGLTFLLPVLGVVAGIFFLASLYFAYARHLFSPRGRNIQVKMQSLLLDRLSGWDGMGTVLDIGCGSGQLTIQIAQRHPQAQVIGIDSWGKGWEYSKGICDRNAAIERVTGRVSFEAASASSLPYADGAFDVVVSNMVFHEVRDVRDKRELIKEALRVVKEGGTFVFQDLFLWKQVYGEVNDLLETMRNWGIETVDFVDTSALPFVPRALKLPFMLGTAAIACGSK